MNRNLIFVLLLLILGAACSLQKTEPIITKTDAPSVNPDQKPALVEKESENINNEESVLYIEFALPEEKVQVNLNSVSILKQYLKTVPNQQAETNKMLLSRLEVPRYGPLYLLEFSCYNGLCSYLLLDQQEEGRSYLLSDMAEFQESSLSPDQNKILLHFNRSSVEKNEEVYRSKLILLNIESFQKIEINKKEVPFDFDFNWPVLSASWESESSLEVTFPAADQPLAEAWRAWKEGETVPRTTTINLADKEE